MEIAAKKIIRDKPLKLDFLSAIFPPN